MISARWVLGAVVGLCVIACGGDNLPEVEGIEKVPETDGQSGPAEGKLPAPLAVITRASDGSAIPRVQVRWSIDPGAGRLSDTVSFSDGTGRAQIEYTLGRAVGPYNVRARLAVNGDRNTTFVVSATAAPAITSVNPATFTGGNSVTLTGTGLSASATVEVGGAPAIVTAGTATSLTVVIPICLAAGSQAIRVRVGGAFSNTVNGTYTSSATPVQLAPGEYASIDPAQVTGCATFPGAGVGGAEYLIAPQATGGAGTRTGYRLAGNQVPIVAPPTLPETTVEEPAPGVAREFHDDLRRFERKLSLADRPAGTPPAVARTGIAAAPPPRVGDQKEFKVLNNTSGRYEIQDFTRVQARAKYVGSRVAIFQDVTVPAGGFTDAEFEPMGRLFNDVLYDVDTRAFGIESDVDNNSIVYVLFTPVVNRLTPADRCSSGVITGFFFAIDIDPAYSADQRANQAEVFYTLVPDPQAGVTCTVPKTRIGQIVPSTFAHEFQHMISYSQHVLFRNNISEDRWLDEALAHLAEELAAVRMRDNGDIQAFSDFVIGDLYDAFLYLKTPGDHFTLYTEGTGTLSERGASWLFLRWLVDKFGPSLTRRLVETPLIGTENLVTATGEPLSRLLAQWFLANYVSDLPGFTPPNRLKYESWAFRTTYASLNQQNPQRFDRPFPLVPQIVGGTFVVGDTLKAGSGDYFRIVQGPAQAGFTLQMTDATGGVLGTTATPRLNIVRIR